MGSIHAHLSPKLAHAEGRASTQQLEVVLLAALIDARTLYCMCCAMKAKAARAVQPCWHTCHAWLHAMRAQPSIRGPGENKQATHLVGVVLQAADEDILQALHLSHIVAGRLHQIRQGIPAASPPRLSL